MLPSANRLVIGAYRTLLHGAGRAGVLLPSEPIASAADFSRLMVIGLRLCLFLEGWTIGGLFCSVKDEERHDGRTSAALII